MIDFLNQMAQSLITLAVTTKGFLDQVNEIPYLKAIGHLATASTIICAIIWAIKRWRFKP